ncbi:T-cell activation Rho GTPase-activating protein [Bombina bombina]|uniref:T-cell activation Rho GTPase-activating protein n=1 Tax=Bombina bombina TaxID=8345 RepID=UPI00235AF1D4|nr:T-cell activation Rho GTPase-activating protein [Bombina bombina]
MSAPLSSNRERRGSYDGIVLNKNSLHKNLAHRRCSAPSIVFPKALSKPWSTGRDTGGCAISIEQCPFVLGLTNEDSELILHECVQLTQDLKTKERYLFLFSDMIIIAKLKSGTSFRLKYRVDLSEMMALSCDEEDDEEEACSYHNTPKNALILIWPYNGCIASFRSLEVKELWFDTLIWQIREVGGLESATNASAKLLMKVLTGCNASKALNVNDMETLIKCPTELDPKKYHLLAAMFNEDGICNVRETSKKRRGVISWPFTLRKSSTLPETSSPPELNAPLFDQPLSILCEEKTLPRPVLDILTILRLKGPSTEGVFRKAANEKARKELKDDLNYGRPLDLKSKPVHLLAVLLKDFLRGIPNQILSTELYHEWMAALDKSDLTERIAELKCVADKLPKPNLLLLHHLICVLHHINAASAINKMDSHNLAVCIGPNMLITEHHNNLQLETQKQVNDKVICLVEFFIENCFDLFGENVSEVISAPEEDSLDNIDTAELYTHQNDSAYDSMDPDLDCQNNTFLSYQEHHGRNSRSGTRKLHGSLDQDLPISHATQFKNVLSGTNRRCSEPYVLPSKETIDNVTGQKLTRSHGDVTVPNKGAFLNEEELNKHESQEYNSSAIYKQKKPNGMTVCTNYPLDLSDDFLPNTFSNSSLESSYSDCSVFTSSPLASPASPTTNGLQRHQSFSSKCKERTDTVQTGREIKKHSKSFCFVNHKKLLAKTQSWGPEGQNEGLQRNRLSSSFKNKIQTECNSAQDKTFKQPAVVRLKRPTRLFSAEEVFRIVDQRNPGKPPSYEVAIHKNMGHEVPSYNSITVKNLQETVSSKDNLTSHAKTEHTMDSCHRTYTSFSKNQSKTELEVQRENTSTGVIQPSCQGKQTMAIRERTMSESIQKNKPECLSRRCSQPLFEMYDQIQYAKESYV